MAQLVDARVWTVDNLIINSTLVFAPSVLPVSTFTVGTLAVSGNTTAGGDITLANNKFLLGTETTGATKNLISLRGNNQIVVGDTGEAINILGVIINRPEFNNGLIISGDALHITVAISKIIPGATSMSLRNNADNADNILIADGGTVTVRSLAGAGSRAVVADANGVLSAP
jgi:hypothetical protein